MMVSKAYRAPNRISDVLNLFFSKGKNRQYFLTKLSIYYFSLKCIVHFSNQYFWKLRSPVALTCIPCGVSPRLPRGRSRAWPAQPHGSPRPPSPCPPCPPAGTPRSAGTCHGPDGSGKNLKGNVSKFFHCNISTLKVSCLTVKTLPPGQSLAINLS